MSSLLPTMSRWRGLSIVVIATSVLPIVGVLFLGWQVFHIALFYWFEVFVIGAWEVLSLLIRGGDPEVAARIAAAVRQSETGIERLIHRVRLGQFHVFQRMIGALVMVIVFGIMLTIYGAVILYYLSDGLAENMLLVVPASQAEIMLLAVPAAILIYIFTTGLKWPAFVILVRYMYVGIIDLVTAWRSGHTQATPGVPGSFLMHIVFLHLASFACIVLIDVLGSPVLFVLAILVGKSLVELYFARHDLGWGSA